MGEGEEVLTCAKGTIDVFLVRLVLGVCCVAAVLLLFAYVLLAPARPLSMRTVSLLSGDTCYVDMLATFHDVGTYGMDVVQMYERQQDGWGPWRQCKTGALVKVTGAMIQAGKDEAARRAEEAFEYATLKARAQEILRERER